MTKFSTRRSGIALGISAVAIAAALAYSTPAMAQSTSTLQGHVEGAAAGTTVKATDTVTGQSVTTTVDANGNYVIVGLRPSTYTVEATGVETQTITVPVGQTVNYDLGNPTGQDIVVTGARGAHVEARTAVISTNVSQAQIENLPQNDRNFLNFAALAPGVSVSPSSGNRSIQAGGVSSDNINVFIDGTSFKNQVGHGGVAGQSFSPGNPFPQSAIQEFKVDTQNFKAEYEQAGSAIITAVTKTGGADFHGGALVEFQPKSFLGRPFFDRPGEANNPTGSSPKPDYKRYQFGGDFGGPIIKDLLHFYVAYEGTRQTNPSTTVNLQSPVPASIIAANNGSFGAQFKQDLFFGKLSLFASANDTINVSIFDRRENNLADFGGREVQSHGRNLQNNIRVYQGDYTHRGDNFLNEATVAYQTIVTGTPRLGSGPEIRLTGGVGGGEVAFLGSHFFVQSSNSKTLTFRDNVTFTGGDHTVKAGVKLAFNKYARLEDAFGNGSYFFNAATFTGFDSSTPDAVQISVRPIIPASAKNTQIGLFAQDDWSPNEHWTFNLGLRWDFESNAKNENFVTPAGLAAQLRAYPGWKAAGINAEDYISTGSNRHPFYGAFQPRLGVSYDVNGDRDLVFFAGAGRYYDRPLFLPTQLETIKDIIASDVRCSFAPTNSCGFPFTAALRDPAALRTALGATGFAGDVWLLPNKLKTQYSDQFNVGVRKRFGQIQAALTLSHIHSANIFQYVRGNRFSNGWFTRVLQRDSLGNVIGCTNGGPLWIVDSFPSVDYAACPATQGQLAGHNGKLNIGANEGTADYNAIYLTVDKPYTTASGWGFTVSATYQDPKTNVGTELGADEFFEGPSQTQFGKEFVQGVDRYRIVATGIVDVVWGIRASGTATFASGPSFGRVDFSQPNVPENACCIANLGGIRYPTKTFAYKNVDLRLSKTFKMPWGGHELTIDGAVFNVFDSVNRNYSAWGAGNNPPSFTENSTVGNARSFQVGAKYKF